MIIPHSVYVGVVLSTVNYFILTSVLEVLCSGVLHHIMWCNQSQKFDYLQGCVNNTICSHYYTLNTCTDWLSTLLEISCISIPYTWIFLTHWERNNRVTFQISHNIFSGGFRAARLPREATRAARAVSLWVEKNPVPPPNSRALDWSVVLTVRWLCLIVPQRQYSTW